MISKTGLLSICIALFTASALFPTAVSAQQNPQDEIPQAHKLYKFTPIVDLKATSPKNQAETGTCWCHSTISLLESELIRKGKGEHDLSEMFIVRNNYVERMADDYMREGKGNLNEGAFMHNVLDWITKYGIMPESAYNGINYDSPTHNHRELNRFVHAIQGVAVSEHHRSEEYYKLVNSLLDIYLGKVPEEFEYNGKKYTAKSFAKELGLDNVLNEYIPLTSVLHHPMHELVDVEWPDNWNHRKYYNVTLDEFMAIMDNALNNGYTFGWSGDLTKRCCSCWKGIAINPAPEYFEEAVKFEKKYPEINVTPEIRQKDYEDFKTLDCHAMHITGMLKDQDGTIFYKVKDSFNQETNPVTNGYVYMSRSYIMMRTLTILVHKDAIPAGIRKSLGIK